MGGIQAQRSAHVGLNPCPIDRKIFDCQRAALLPPLFYGFGNAFLPLFQIAKLIALHELASEVDQWNRAAEFRSVSFA